MAMSLRRTALFTPGRLLFRRLAKAAASGPRVGERAKQSPVVKRVIQKPPTEGPILVTFNQEYASRADLDRMFGDLQIDNVDAILSRSLNPMGQWVLSATDKAVQSEILKRSYQDLYRRTQASHIDQYDVKYLTTASKFRIYRNMLRVHRDEKNFTLSELEYVFDTFDLSPNPFRTIRTNDRTTSKDWYVSFKSFEDAISAYQQKDGFIISGSRLFLTLYDI